MGQVFPVSIFKVSIIIPVYNAGPFVTQAVVSALNQLETGEVILIEDGSTDNSLEVCQSLADKYQKVRLLRHPKGKNLGAGASRNLGMRNAKYDYIAFLDADDYYLPGRFSVTKEIFSSVQDCDGVYEAIGKHIEDKSAKERWLASGELLGDLITISKRISPKELFSKLVLGGAGSIHLDGVVLSKNIIDQVGYMHGALKYHQDNDFLYRLSAVGKLFPGRIDRAVGMYRIHSKNRITAPRSTVERYHSRIKLFKYSYRWFKTNAYFDNSQIILRRLFSYAKKTRQLNKPNIRYTETGLNRRIRLMLLIFQLPEIVIEPQFWLELLPEKCKTLLS